KRVNGRAVGSHGWTGALAGTLAVLLLAAGCGATHHSSASAPRAAAHNAVSATSTRPSQVKVSGAGTSTLQLGAGGSVSVPAGPAPGGAAPRPTSAGPPPPARARPLRPPPDPLDLSTGELPGAAPFTFVSAPATAPAGVPPAAALGIATYDDASSSWIDVPV